MFVADQDFDAYVRSHSAYLFDREATDSGKVFSDGG